MRESIKKRNNRIIAGLLIVVTMMTVAYAAFATSLNIKGTTSINSKWEILITNVEAINITSRYESNPSEDLTTEENKHPNSLTTTISSKLISPGDSITYNITVQNNSSFNAKLNKVEMSKSNNPAITISKSGLTQGTILNTGESAVLTVKVKYEDVTEQPSNTTSDFTISLDYVQSSSYDEEKYTIDYYGITDNNATAEKLFTREVYFDETDNNVDVGTQPSEYKYTGYVLESWSTIENKEGIILDNNTTFNDLVNGDRTVKNISVYANWVKKKYTVYYDADGGTPKMQSKQVEWTNSGLNETPETRIKTGYKFGGWFTKPNGKGSYVNNNLELSTILKDDTKDSITLYASWAPKRYIIKYDTQGGSDITDNRSWSAYVIYGITDPAARLGYNFGGWYTKPNGKGKKITDDMIIGDVIKSQYGSGVDEVPDNTVSIYAYWIEKTYTLTFSRNDSKKARADNMPTERTLKWTEKGLTNVTSPTREGYTFTGWTITKGGTDFITSNMSAADFADYDTYVTIYAKWTKNS